MGIISLNLDNSYIIRKYCVEELFCMGLKQAHERNE